MQSRKDEANRGRRRRNRRNEWQATTTFHSSTAPPIPFSASLSKYLKTPFPSFQSALLIPNGRCNVTWNRRHLIFYKLNPISYNFWYTSSDRIFTLTRCSFDCWYWISFFSATRSGSIKPFVVRSDAARPSSHLKPARADQMITNAVTVIPWSHLLIDI